MVGITGYALKNGDPMAMITPFDSEGYKCGMPNQGPLNKTDMTDYPYKFMYNLFYLADGKVTPEAYKSSCVKSCPDIGVAPSCIKGDGSTTDCASASEYGTSLYRTYCLPNKTFR
jgi:hypothetical protein